MTDNGIHNGVAEITGIPEELKTYTTKRTGIKLRLKAVPQLLIGKVQESIKNPAVPQYKVDTVAGPEWHDYDEEGIKEDDTPEEDRRKWREYQAKLKEAERMRSQRMTDLFMSRGVDFDLPDNEDWIETQEYILGLTVPPADKPLARRLHYLQTEVLTEPEDLTEVMLRIMALTGGSETSLAEVRDLFQRAIQGQADQRVDAESGPGPVLAEA